MARLGPLAWRRGGLKVTVAMRYTPGHGRAGTGPIRTATGLSRLIPIPLPNTPTLFSPRVPFEEVGCHLSATRPSCVRREVGGRLRWVGGCDCRAGRFEVHRRCFYCWDCWFVGCWLWGGVYSAI